ncbi:uncharacterized protein LOC106730673 isoform X2 [Camelus ferus]|nr:uncharacterized protein LOC105094680 isoform X2 [Camelus dromedarius]XP_032324822.1 uncharacterized protein LOC106730673 isoform X2 [Camelus ferus]XP_045372675.1 uncharacterized protein LOC105069065 isoform X2 [Camelus bactrianus]
MRLIIPAAERPGDPAQGAGTRGWGHRRGKRREDHNSQQQRKTHAPHTHKGEIKAQRAYRISSEGWVSRARMQKREQPSETAGWPTVRIGTHHNLSRKLQSLLPEDQLTHPRNHRTWSTCAIWSEGKPCGTGSEVKQKDIQQKKKKENIQRRYRKSEQHRFHVGEVILRQVTEPK